MLNLFMTMVRKEDKTNAKSKAIKQFENSQNLEFIMWFFVINISIN